MPKLKINNRFGITPNDLLNDPTISWKAKGLYGYLQSKPDDWDFSALRISKDADDGEKSTIAGLKELENAGYLERIKYQNELGHWEIEYNLFDIPNAENRQAEKIPNAENPHAENPHAENPHAENRQTKKTRDTKKEEQRKIYIDNEIINDFIIEFIENRKQLKNPMTDLAIKKLVNKCNLWIEKFDDQIIKTFFDRAIESGWTGVFELKQNTFQKTPAKKLSYEQESSRKEFAFN